MASIEVMVPSARLALASKLSDSRDQIYDVEVLQERRHNTENKWLSYQKQISKAYNKKVRPRARYVGGLVLKVAGHVQKCLSVSNFSPKWEGHPMLFLKPLIVTISYFSTGFQKMSRQPSMLNG